MNFELIPKIIHQIWLGPKTPPNWCINSWRNNYLLNYPDWEYKLWTEKDIKNIKLKTQNIFEKEETWRGKADILRYEILYNEGGIFIDADSFSLNKNLEDLIIDSKDYNLFVGKEPNDNVDYANGVIGCKKHSIEMLNLINYLNQNYDELLKKHPKKYDVWLRTGPVVMNTIIKKNIKIYPSNYFYPEGFIKNNIKKDFTKFKEQFPNSYMYQYWLSHYN